MIVLAVLLTSLPAVFGLFFGGLGGFGGGGGCPCPRYVYVPCAPPPVCPQPMPCVQVASAPAACPSVVAYTQPYVQQQPSSSYFQPSSSYAQPQPSSSYVQQPSSNYVQQQPSYAQVPPAVAVPAPAISSYGSAYEVGVPTAQRSETITTVTTEGAYSNPYGPATVGAAAKSVDRAPIVDNTVSAPTPAPTATENPDSPDTLTPDMYDDDALEVRERQTAEEVGKTPLDVAPVSREPSQLIPADMMTRCRRVLTGAKGVLNRPVNDLQWEEDLDPAICNNRQLRSIMASAMTNELSTSKKMIKRATKLAFGIAFDVLCADEDFSYSIYSRHYCETTKENITCFAYL